MWDADRQAARRRAPAAKQRGGTAVEFALLVIVFLMLVCGILELARLVYMFSTLQEVSRRVAALAINSPFDAASQSDVQSRALFLDRNNNLVMGEPVTPAHLQLQYLSIQRDGAGALTMAEVNPLPASPAQNRLNCLTDPNGANCIRMVRVRVCKPGSGSACEKVPYQMLFPFVDFTTLNLPRSETIMPAQTLGYTLGDIPAG